MRELLLHVGMHKTGTSSIQQTLLAERAVLQEAGFSYLDAGANHSRIVYSAFCEAPHLYHVNRRHGLHGVAEAAGFAAGCRDRLARFLAEAPGPRLVISGEDIGVLGRAGVARMLAAFRPLVDRIVVIGFVRPPLSFIASAIQQRIRGGSTLAEVSDGVVPQYRHRFEPFRGAPEVAELRLQPYERAALASGCSVATFLQLCGAPPELYDRLTVDRANAGASRLGVVLALAANEAVPVFLPDGTANPARTPRLARFLDQLEGPRFAAPPALLAPHLARIAEDVAWMEAVLGRPFPEAETRLDPAALAAPGDALDALDRPEIEALARALNALLRDGEAAGLRRPRAAAAPAVPRPAKARADAAAPAADAPPDGPPAGPLGGGRLSPAEREARRAARRAARQGDGRPGQGRRAADAGAAPR